MSAYRTARAISGLNGCLERIREDGQRFRDNPLRAVAMFAEGDADPSRRLVSLLDHGPAARFLNIDPACLKMAQSAVFANRDTAHDGPYFVYLAPHLMQSGDDIERELERQLHALSRVFPQLAEAVSLISEPVALRFLPAEVETWWKSLFHLAIHYPRPFLEAVRKRWINVTGPAPELDPQRTMPLQYPHEERISEKALQIGWFSAPFGDVVPGIIWSVLRDDVFTSTARAIEFLIEQLQTENTTNGEPDASAITKTFAGLHQQFTALAEWERRMRPPTEQTTAPLFGGREIELVKVGDSFRIPPAREWCNFPMRLRFETVLLARRHADAEYLFYRAMPSDFLRLSEQAGSALPSSIGDWPVMFHRREIIPNGIIQVTECNGSQRVGMQPANSPDIPPDFCGGGLNPEPIARWVRFVFNVLRAGDPSGKEISFHYQNAPADDPYAIEDIFGYAKFPNGFFSASAQAIEVAGLLKPGLIQEDASIPLLQQRIKPRWDSQRRELWYGEQLVKRFRQPSENQVLVISTFHDDDWPDRVDSPFPDNQTDKLNDAVRALNRNQSILRFAKDGTREGILWSMKASS